MIDPLPRQYYVMPPDEPGDMWGVYDRVSGIVALTINKRDARLVCFALNELHKQEAAIK